MRWVILLVLLFLSLLTAIVVMAVSGMLHVVLIAVVVAWLLNRVRQVRRRRPV